jgi:hypothetical protein
MSFLTRRRFLTNMAAGGISCGFFSSPLSWALSPQNDQDDHFFLQVFINGGMDPLYWFDSRPLEMTEAGLQANYLSKEPVLWKGKNGGETWGTELVEPLRAYWDRFSVLNGVLMAPNFDGHEQNVNFLFAGNAFGGECYIPHLNSIGRARPLDGVMSSSLGADLNNMGKTVPLNAGSAAGLVATIKKFPSIDLKLPTLSHIKGRMEQNGLGMGRFSAASRVLSNSLSEAPSLAASLSQVDLGATNKDGVTEEEKFLHLMSGLFKSGVTKSAILGIEPNQQVDTHDSESAKNQPTLYRELAEKLEIVFRGLRDIEFKPGVSLWDVTTVLVGSEFGRTMRQVGSAINESGTDHNPLNASLIIGGKGIKGGMVVGASDFKSSKESLSGAHLEKDKAKLKTMGRPFNLGSLLPSNSQPEQFHVDHYLNVASVVNTIYQNFGVSADKYRVLERNGPSAPILRALLV